MKWLTVLFLAALFPLVVVPAAAQETATPTPTLTPTPTATPTPIREALVPIGAIQMYTGDSPPPGWLWCNGAAVGRADYPELFAVIGTTFGAGDGVSTFNLPNCAGRVPVGVGWGTDITPRNLGDTWGSETHMLTVTELPSHSHPRNPSSITERLIFTFLQAGGWGAGGYTVSGYGESAVTGNTGGGQAHNNMQPSLALGFIVWTGAVALDLPTGGGGGSNPVPDVTPAPEIMYYATVQVGEQSANTAVVMSITAGEFVIALALFAIVGLLLIQMVMKAREQ